MPDQKSIIKAFLSNYVLFSSMDDELLEEIVESVKVITLKPEETLYLDGENSRDFYVVWSGRLHNFKPHDRERELATLIIGDFFGEDGLIFNRRYGCVEALETSKLFKFDFSFMIDLFTRAPQLKKLLTTAAKSRKLVYVRHLKWLGEDESLYFVARKHVFFLLLYLVLPVLILIGSTIFAVNALLAFEYNAFAFWTPAIIILLSILGIVGQVLDWANDYYVVTSQRVIWVEKMIAIYDSRQEAPLDTILTINRIFNPSLRLLIDYATVIVKTYTGSIRMRWSQNPDEMVFFIEGFKARARAIARQFENRAMESVIRQRLNPELQRPSKPETPAGNPQKVKSRSKFLSWFRNAMKMRYEEGDYITYRKHWFILIRKTFFPTIVNLGLILAAFYSFLNDFSIGFGLILLWSLLLMIGGIWWLYQYVDWRNDIYVLTLDKIFDIERKPLTREDKREASLANILSLENARIGLTGLILNYGTVTINVGNEKLTFDYVFNPVQVQYEISDRMYAFRKRKEEEEAARDRERVADWLMAYHRQLNQLENDENSAREQDISG
jgi:hypothetical protein